MARASHEGVEVANRFLRSVIRVFTVCRMETSSIPSSSSIITSSSKKKQWGGREGRGGEGRGGEGSGVGGWARVEEGKKEGERERRGKGGRWNGRIEVCSVKAGSVCLDPPAPRCWKGLAACSPPWHHSHYANWYPWPGHSSFPSPWG